MMRNGHSLKGNEADDFGIVNVGDLKGSIDQFTGAIAMVVTPITLLSLVVGGIVVMNIMLMSVTERTFEIGLRKAIGAKRSQILTQFLIESSLLASVGGALGLGWRPCFPPLFEPQHRYRWRLPSAMCSCRCSYRAALA